MVIRVSLVVLKIEFRLLSSSYVFSATSIYIYKSQLKNKEEGKSETTDTGISQRTYRRAKQTNKKKMLVERKGAQCKLKAGAILEELKSN